MSQEKRVEVTGHAHRSNGEVKFPVCLSYLKHEPVVMCRMTATEAVAFAANLANAAHSLLRSQEAKSE